MATVKCTDTILNDIVNKACESYTAELSKLLVITDPVIADKLYRLYVTAEDEHMLSNLHKDWNIEDATQIQVNAVDDTDSHVFSLTVKFSNKRPVARYWNNQPTRDGWREPCSPFIETHNNELWPRIEQKVLEQLSLPTDYFAEVDRIVTARTKLLDGIKKVIDATPTINAALKVWPGLELYLKAEMKERLNRANEKRAKPESIAASLDLSELNIEHITQRMSGGTT